MRTKKMFLFFAAFLFAAVAGYNIHLAQTQNSGDISLADIAVMAQADIESGVTYYQSMAYCQGMGMQLCCTKIPRAYLCSLYACTC